MVIAEIFAQAGSSKFCQQMVGMLSTECAGVGMFTQAGSNGLIEQIEGVAAAAEVKLAPGVAGVLPGDGIVNEKESH